MKKIILFCLVLIGFSVSAQDTTKVYKKRVLENVEIDLLASYYTQDGANASVSGGIGSEELKNNVEHIVISIPINADDVVTIDAGVSGYSSASSSNLDPFDGNNPADPFVTSSGASSSDVLANVTASYSHSSDDRNNIWSGYGAFATEYDYTSIGFGGSFTKLFNQKNTELTVHASAYLDNWGVLYPKELKNKFDIDKYTVTGNENYNHQFTEFDNTNRNSFSGGLGFSQILSKRLQGSLALDFTQQQGLLSNHMQRVYFSDVEGAFIDNFRLADDVERLPDTRFKTAVGGRLNYYVNEYVSLRSFYRYYFDDWGIKSHTASIEVPIKINYNWTIYPTYRYYNQTAADYFAPYAQHLSTDEFYTSDYDLSKYNANQFGFGISYSDPLTKRHLWRFHFKSIDLKYDTYKRNTGLSAHIITLGVKLELQKKNGKYF